MSVIVTFLALVALGTGWWLSRQRLLSKPWLETGTAPPGEWSSGASAGVTGLVVFVVVIGGLFAMLGSAFVMQIEATPWELAPLPPLIWINTALILLSSVFLQCAVWATRQGRGGLLHASLGAAGISALAFLIGQAEVWKMLTASGYQLGSAPAASFFYLITGLHGLHILGGLTAMGVIWIGSVSVQQPGRMQPGIRLCALYWHALLGIWLVLFALLQGWGNDFLALCRAVIS